MSANDVTVHLALVPGLGSAARGTVGGVRRVMTLRSLTYTYTYYTHLLMYLLTYLRARRPRGYQEVPARTRALPRADVRREQSVVSTNLLTCLLLTDTCLLLTCLLKGLTASAASDGTRRRRMHACAIPTGAHTREPSR